jgi:D-xylose transport system permease protein
MNAQAQNPVPLTEKSGMGSLFASYRRRLTVGDMGSVPTIIGLFAIWGIFQALNHHFLDPFNLTNLMLQIAGMGTITVGMTMVLLLGEIDLSASYVGGVAAALMAVLSVQWGWPGPLAVLAGIVAGIGIGILQGTWITRFRIPSFVLTLAGYIGWQGAMLYILGATGSFNLTDPFITAIAGTFYPAVVGWVLAIVFVGAFAVNAMLSRRTRLRAGLPAGTQTRSGAMIVAVAVAVLGGVFIMNRDRGLPSAVIILIALITIFDFVTRRTRFGRQIYAVGGNAEAARRAGIAIDRVRLAVYALCSTLAATGGILLASRNLSVYQGFGSGDLLLDSIAAAVIGGTSLFGGRGRVWGALLGALVIGSISNGMDLLSVQSSVKFVFTAIVLAAAVTIESIGRGGQRAAGVV